MNKKGIILALSIAMLTGCGNNAENNDTVNSNESSIESSVVSSEEENDNSNKKSESKDTKETNDDNSFASTKNIGETKTSKDLDYEIKKAGTYDNEFTSGPFKFSITGVSAGEMTPKSEDMKTYFQDKDSTQAIIIYATAENTEDKKAYLSLNYSTLTTDTKEQLEPDLFLSEGNEEFLGAVKQNMSMVYYPETNVEDINEITLHVNGYTNEDFEVKGEENKITIKFDDKGRVESIEGK